MPEMKREDPELTMLRNNKSSGYEYRLRRHKDWDENYELYRDKVTINRLTQRQSVNLPIMKQTVRTLLKDVDDMPVLFFENLDNDKEAEILKNEYWKWTISQNKMDLQDIVDKRQVFLFGRSFMQMQIIDGKVNMEVVDPMDILVDRYCDPFNIHSSRFLIHSHIFVPLAVLERNPDYDQTKIKRMKKWYQSEEGIIKASDNRQMLEDKNKKLSDIGVMDVYDPVLGETYVELAMHFVYREEKDEDEQLYLYVEAEDMEILMKKPLEEVIGTTEDNFWRNHLPYNTWADDVERQDFWSDGVGDIVRTPNKVINSWFSQMVENRTLRNFGMQYYDSTTEGFEPNTFQPVPWGWYGVPGNPKDIIQRVEIPDLSESLDEMDFLLNTIDKASGATATQQGVQTQRQITLGEVQLALGEAKERIKGMSKFYTPAWKDRGLLFMKMVEAGAGELDPITIHKQGRNSTNVFTREISAKDWTTKKGYRVKVWAQDEKLEQDTQSLEKLNAAMNNMPDNPKLREVYQRKLLEFAGLPPDDINEIMQYEEQKKEAIMDALDKGIVPEELEEDEDAPGKGNPRSVSPNAPPPPPTNVPQQRPTI